MAGKVFTAAQIIALADALGDTECGLTGTEIEHLIRQCGMTDPGPGTKRHRLHDAFAESQNRLQDRTRILGFIRKAMSPARFARDQHRYEPLRMNVNRALAFCGMVISDAGELQATKAATTLPEADRRARELRADLESRRVHSDVLVFCRAELLADDYFHAVLEAVKSVAEKIREKTGLSDDGNALVDRALTGSPPLLAINALDNPNEISEQNGFAHLVRALFGMFRNPPAHAPRIRWKMGKEDAEDLLTTVSLVHRRLDRSHMPPRV